MSSAPHQPIVQDLVSLVDQGIGPPRALFDAAIAQLHVDYPNLVELTTVVDFESFLNWLDDFLAWIPNEEPVPGIKTGTAVYQHLCAFNFVFNLPPIMPYQSKVVPEYPPVVSPLSQWMVNFAQALGSNLDKVGTVTPDSLASFENAPSKTPTAGMAGAPGYRVSDYAAPPGGWTTVSFNELFARQFFDIDSQRPVFSQNDDTAIVNAADSGFDGVWDIDDNTVIFDIKNLPWTIQQLLDGSQYSNAFSGGKFMHAFLGPGDYHRQHAPVSGIIREAKVVPGNVYLEVLAKENSKGDLVLKPHRKLQQLVTSSGLGTDLDAPDNPGYQFSQARGLIVIENPVIGLVAFLPVGMCQVSSVVLADNTIVGNTVTKGQEVSHFEFGGSDYVLCFQQQANVDFSYIESFISDDNPSPWFPVRGQYITANPSPSPSS